MELRLEDDILEMHPRIPGDLSLKTYILHDMGLSINKNEKLLKTC